MQAEIRKLVQIRKQLAEYYVAYEQATTLLKAERDSIQAKITEELKKMGILSQRFQEATVSLTVHKTLQVVDETAAVAAMKSRGLTDYVSETLSPLFWDSAAKKIAKQGDTDIPGLVIQEKEFLSVRPSDKEERRKVTTN